MRGRMPTMEIVNERFSRNLRLGLFNFIRRSPEISVGAVQVQKYSAFLRELVVPTNFNIMAVRPLRGNGLVVCEPTLLFGVIDSLFGGNGKFHTRIEGRDFSPTEQRVINRLVDVVSEEYKKAWRGVYPLELAYQRSEMQPQFATIATPSEIVVSTSFTLEIGDITGSLHICIPYATLEPIRDVLYSSVQGDAIEVDRRWIKLLSHEIQAAELTTGGRAGADRRHGGTTAGHADRRLSRTGSHTPPSRPRWTGVPLFECQYGTHKGKYALRIDRKLRGIDMNWLGESYVN